MFQQIIIMEGPDGCGKTTIGRELARRLQIPYFKMNTEFDNWRRGKFKEALEFDQTYLLEFLKQTGYSVVIDRAWPSEWVYSQVFDRRTNMDILEDLDRGFCKLNTHIVIPFRTDYSKNRFDELVPTDRLQEIHDKYFEFDRWTRCVTSNLNVTYYRDDLDTECEYLLSNIVVR